MKGKHAWVLAAVALAAAATGRSVAAQNASAARLAFFQGSPGSKPQLEDAIQRQMNWRRERQDPWRWLTWEYASGEVPRYCVATFGHAWADFDAASGGRAEEIGDASGAAALSSRPPVVQYFEHLDEVSDFGPPADPPTLAEISLYHLHYGKKAQFYAALREFHRALSRAGPASRYEWFELRSGGETPQFMLLTPRANWAAFDAGGNLLLERLEQAAGKRKAAKIFDQFTSAVKRHERSAVRLRPDLSLLPAAANPKP